MRALIKRDLRTYTMISLKIYVEKNTRHRQIA